MRVLVVEDEPKMLGLLRRGLAEEGHVADGARDGETAVAMALASTYDVIALDIMLPRQDGLAVCRQLRERDVWTPILLLTARDSVEDRVRGLDNGADDYLNKPFDFDELLARLRALTRRKLPPREAELSVAGLRLDPATRRVWRGETDGALAFPAARVRVGLRAGAPVERGRRLHPPASRQGRPPV
jgi:two-component system, OmpR family, response regulator